jgi:FAD binding domain-containing protein/berberine-like enzyme
MFTTSEIATFAKGLRGQLLRPGDGNYDDARRVWNGMIDKRPALIVRAAGVVDVIQAVEFARESGLVLAVRGGGHNVSGNAVCDGGLTLDLSLMRSVRVDPKRQSLSAEGGTLWRDLDHEAESFGLATTGGLISSTGVAGLTLGGGLGWLMGSYGLACDNLLSAELVTAAGELVTASASEKADLFWGLRGGGGNFGVAASLEYRLHPVGLMLGGLIIHPLEQAADLFRFYEKFTREAPDALGSMLLFVTSPDGERVAALAVCYNGPPEEGEVLLAPLRAFGSPLADTIGPMRYTQIQQMFDEGFPAGLQNYWRSSFLEYLDGDGIEAIVERFRQAPSPQAAIAIEQLGGAAARVSAEDTAFNHRASRFNLLILGMWPERNAKAENVKWVQSTSETLAPNASSRVYVNYLGQSGDEGVGRVKAAYGPESYARLVALKNKYDPENLFRLNQNIQPTANS